MSEVPLTTVEEDILLETSYAGEDACSPRKKSEKEVMEK